MAGNRQDEVLLYAVGDVGVTRADPETIFDHVRAELQKADIGFCPLEVNLTTGGAPLPQLPYHLRGRPESAQAMRQAGLTVASMAGNHLFDLGREGYDDTRAALALAGIEVVGVGENLSEARAPLIIESKGTKIGILSYCSVFPPGYAATNAKAGCAPLRAYTHYEPYEPHQPGNPSRIHTWVDPHDLKAMLDDIVSTRPKVDVLILSLHWGVHFSRAVIADYQKAIAHAAVDAGVDLILGHHPHILKGIETYKNVPIFYSMCNFALDMPLYGSDIERANFAYFRTLNPDWPEIVEGDPYPFPPESRMTIVVKAIIADGKIRKTAILPAFINENADPEILESSDTRFAQVVEYLDAISTDQKIGFKYCRDGNEVLIQQDVIQAR